MVALNGPQDTGSATSGGHTGDAGRFGLLELVVILLQDRLVQEQSRERIHQNATQMNVADLDDPFTFTFALTGARVIASTDQAAAAEDLGSVGIVGGIADGPARPAT